jgi:DNA-binding Lrp family transcriptional regulator
MMNDLVILNFQEARQPEYREKRGKGYIEFGEKNDYPNYLLALYNKSAKHNAIVKGKVNYIIGNGWKADEPDPIADQFIAQPNQFESLADLTRKVSIDIEIFGGAYLEVIWSVTGGQLTDVLHIDYTKIRSNADNSQFWYKKDWNERKDELIPMMAFNTKVRQGKQILYIKEYRPGLDTYALPGYMGALNYIESDIEVSRHVLGNAQTGFSASKLITLPNGEPSPDEKRNIERRFTDRFSGSDGKKFILSFTTDPARKPIIEDLGASDITKEDFTRVDLIIQNNLFAGHQITSPSLFGIAEPGQLGSRTQMRDSYEIFKNTYVNDKQQFLESIFNELAVLKGATSEISIIPVEPIGYEFSEAILTQNMTKDELREALNLPAIEQTASSSAQAVTDAINGLSPLVANKVLESMSANEIRALVGLGGVVGGETPVGSTVDSTISDGMNSENPVNDNLKNLSGRQYQHLMRVIRQFSQGKISKEIATTMLKSGLGMTDNEVNAMLGIDDDPMTEDFSFSALDEDTVIGLFREVGEPKEDYNIIHSKAVFSSRDAFAEDVLIDKTLDKQILALIDKDKKISIDDIAKAVGKSREVVQGRLSYLVESGALNYNPKIEERKLTKPLSKLVDDMEITTFEVKYSYEWKPIVPSSERDTAAHPSRTFCRKLISEDRLWSRAGIEMLSARLGYSVFDRGGGWWGDSPSCRHQWVRNVVVKKKK